MTCDGHTNRKTVTFYLTAMTALSDKFYMSRPGEYQANCKEIRGDFLILPENYYLARHVYKPLRIAGGKL